MFLKTFHIPWAVQKECSSVNQLLYHVVLIYIRWVMACYKVSLVNQVCWLNRFLTKAKVRHCNTTGLLRVIIKVSLCIHVCVITNDLDGVLVCSNSTICSKSPELTVDCSFWCCNNRSTCFKRKVCNIINDTDCEFFFSSVLINSYDLCRCSIFGT